MIASCGSQLRLGIMTTPAGAITRPFALDYGAVMMIGQARGVDLDLLAEVLPAAEGAIVGRLTGDGSDVAECD